MGQNISQLTVFEGVVHNTILCLLLLENGGLWLKFGGGVVGHKDNM